MCREQRIAAMEELPKHIGEFVKITYVDQWDKRETIQGDLSGVEPFTYLKLLHHEGGQSLVTSGLPFVGNPEAIISITAGDGTVLYDNELICPGYNPNFGPRLDTDGRFRLGGDLAEGKAFGGQIRQLSFGRR